MEQLTLDELLGIPDSVADKSEYVVDKFSAGDFCDETERDSLETKYEPILEVTKKI